MNHLEPQAGYHVAQGKIFNQRETKGWSEEMKAFVEYDENHKMFKNFSAEDQGRSAILLATFESRKECADFVEMHNRLLDKIDLLECELKEALDELKMYRV